MTTINANLRISGTTTPLDGFIRVESVQSFNDDTYLYLPEVKDFPLTFGTVTFTLAASDLAKVSYRFKIYQTATPDPILVKEFYAVVPSSSTPIDIKDLAAQNGLRYDAQDSSLLTLGKFIYSSDIFWAFLADKVFANQGAWSNAQFYKKGDVVTYNGSAYQYINNIASSGNPPTNITYFRLLVSKGDTGTGTAGNNTAYGGTWSGATDAPSRNAVYNIIQTLATSAQLATYAPLASPNLTGNPTATTQAPGDNSTRIATTAYVTAGISAVGQVPIGAMLDWATGSAPSKWLLCDGRAVSRTTYALLFAVIGTTFGAGNGTTTFNIPDFRGRNALCLDDLGTAAGAAIRVPGLNTIGGVGGAAYKTLSISEIPSHNHGGSTGAVSNMSISNPYFEGVGSGGLAFIQRVANASSVGNDFNQHAHSIPYQGGGVAFSLLDPFLSVPKIIYAGV